MINKRFLNFKTYAEFSRLKEAGEIRQESIVWIADTNQMWTHGTLYSSITEEQARKLAGILTNGAGLKYLTDKLTYEELPDQATVIDIDGKIMDLTTESSNEDILAVFGTLPDFTSLIETVRNSETILNSILVDNDSQVGKVNATILANKTSNTLDVIYFDHVKKTFVQLTITETDSVLSCVREEFGSAGGRDTTPEVAITEAEPVPGSQEKVYYQVVEDNIDLGVDTDAPADGNMYGRKDNAWQKIEATSQPDLSNYLAKDNSTEFTPTEDYNPATKKYVDDKINIPSIDITNYYGQETVVPQTFLDEIITKIDNKEISQGKLCIINYQKNSSTPIYAYNVSYRWKKDIVYINGFYSLTPNYGNGSDDGNSFVFIELEANQPIKIKYSGDISQRILTESEYSALGDTPLTDNVLYFVTPDA